MKVLAFAGSNSRNSINRCLVDYTVAQLKAQHKTAQVTLVDLNDYEMPLFSVDREQQDGIPQLAQEFFAKMAESDVLLISFAEHNGQPSVAWKNLFDWMSRINMKVWQGKKLIMLSAVASQSAGSRVLDVMEKHAKIYGAQLLGSHGIGSWHANWDAQSKAPKNDADKQAINALLKQL